MPEWVTVFGRVNHLGAEPGVNRTRHLGLLSMSQRDIHCTSAAHAAQSWTWVQFLPGDAMHSAAIAVTRCLSVRLSVRHVRELRQNE